MFVLVGLSPVDTKVKLGNWWSLERDDFSSENWTCLPEAFLSGFKSILNSTEDHLPTAMLAISFKIWLSLFIDYLSVWWTRWKFSSWSCQASMMCLDSVGKVLQDTIVASLTFLPSALTSPSHHPGRLPPTSPLTLTCSWQRGRRSCSCSKSETFLWLSQVIFL